MQAKIDKNLGTYINRSYRAFDDPSWKGLETLKKSLGKEKADKVSEVSGGAYVGLVNVDGASNADAATALNNHFPDMKGRYEFRDKGNLLAEVPTRSGKRTQTKTIQWSKANEVWLYDSETGKPVMRGGKPIIVNTGESADKNQLKYINEFLADYINPDKYIIN